LSRSVISPLGLTTEGSTKFKQKVENATLKNYSVLPPSDAVRKQENIEDLFSPELLQFKEYRPSKNLKFNDLGIFRSLKLRSTMEIILPSSLKLNFTPNTLGLL